MPPPRYNRQLRHGQSGAGQASPPPAARNGRTAPRQLALEYNDRYQDSLAWQAVLDECNRVVELVGFKQVVFDLNTTRTTLSNALCERDRHYMKGEWLTYLVRRDNTTRLAAALIDPAGCDPVKRRQLTDREKLERLSGVVDKLPEAVRLALYEEAYGVGVKP